MESHLEPKLKTINMDFHKTENKLTLSKQQHFSKSTKNMVHHEQTAEETYLETPQEQGQVLERRAKNNTKFKMSDFQAFLYFASKESLQKEFPELFKMLRICQKPKKTVTEHSHETKVQNVKLLDLGMHELCKFVSFFLEEKVKCRQLMKQKQLSKLVRLISEEYNITSYHNFTHAVSVMVLFRQMAKRLRLSEHFTELQLFVAQMAALAHDLGHKGLNALWEVKTKSYLASIYQSESLLEKMHIAKFFRILKEHKDVDFFQSIKDCRQRDCAKKEFIKLILGTDMAKHFKSIENIQAKSRQNKQNLVLSHKQDILELIFHAADIGNPCMQFDDYMNWSILLTFEFNAQAIKQEQADVAVTPGFKYAGLQNFYNGQIGFIRTFCLPLWKTIAMIYPSGHFYFEKVHQNEMEIEVRLQELKKKLICE